MLKRIIDSLAFRLALLVTATTWVAWLLFSGQWGWLVLAVICWLVAVNLMRQLYKRNAQKVAFMFDAIDNDDYAFKYAVNKLSSDDRLVNKSMNRITQILFQAKHAAAQKEKYYELILNSVNTGVIVLDDKGNIFQTNNEALRLLGLTIFTHIKQLRRVEPAMEELLSNARPGNKYQVTLQNERGTMHLSIRVSEMTLQEKHVRIVAINDINKELDEKEIDSWIRLTRVLTHEIMNAVTPITSLSDTLLSMHGDTNEEISNGLEVISTTGKSLLSFVESYRRFTHIPTPNPSLFFVGKFIDRMVKLAQHHNYFPDITFQVEVEPDDLILYADENLITQVMLNLLKNAMQAIGGERNDGLIHIHAFCNEEEAVIIEVSNNGSAIPPEEAEHIFVPFFTTKANGSGVGLSISRQIMRLSRGSITLQSIPGSKLTTFVLTFT